VADEGTYKSLFDAAMKLIDGRIELDGRPLPRPGFLERRRLLRALRLLERAAEVAPPHGAASLVAAKVEQRLGNAERTLHWLRKAQTMSPDNLIVAIELGATLFQQGFHGEAVRVLSTAATLYPDDPRIQSNLGIALLMAGDVPASIQAFERLSALEPEHGMNRRLLALAREVEEGRKSRPTNQGELARSL